MQIHTSAPGKLFLFGEYVVLYGAPAIITAVEQRAQVKIVPLDTSERKSAVIIRTDHVHESSLKDTSILHKIVAELESRNLFDVDALHGHQVELDTQAFFIGHQKLGLGSSAALTVAILKALFCAMKYDPSSDDQYLDLAIDCHRAFQGKFGSGADVAAAFLGGCIKFCRDSYPEQVELPKDLHLMFVWTGRAAATVPYLKHLTAWREAEPALFSIQFDKLHRLAHSGVGSFSAGQTADFIDIVRQFNYQLEELSDVAGLDFYTETHVELKKLVEAAGCTYKPSGAGGGDFGIIFSDDEERFEPLQRSLHKAGYKTPIDRFGAVVYSN